MFRLAQLITADTRQIITAEIADDMRKFLFEIENEDIDLKSIGIRNANKAWNNRSLISLLRLEKIIQKFRHRYRDNFLVGL